MDRLETMKTFARVADAGSFAAAAQSLGVARSVVSKRVDQLEAHLGARLLQRTTRVVALTEIGAAYYEQCVRILAEIEEIENAVGPLHTEPRGLLRLSAPTSFGTLQLGPVLCRLQTRHPDLRLDLILNDRSPNPIEDGFDVALWDQPGDKGSLGETRITPQRRLLVAAPAYLDRAGRPEGPEALAEHATLHYSFLPGSSQGWRLSGPDGSEVIARIRPRLSTNNGLVMRDACVEGNGIALLPSFLAGPELRAGRLVPVLPDWRPPLFWLCALYPPARRLTAKVRLLLEMLQDSFGPEPPWDAHLFDAAGRPTAPTVRDTEPM